MRAAVEGLTRIKIGDWTVIPSMNLLERNGASVKLEPRAMDLLVYLAKAGDRVVSAEELLREVWQGRVFDDGIVYKRINQLRTALGDDSQAPRFIENIPKRGYRLVAAPVTVPDQEPAPAVEAPERPHRRRPVAAVVGFAAAFATAGVWLLAARAPQPEPALRSQPLAMEQDGKTTFRGAAGGDAIWSPSGDAFVYTVQSNTSEMPQVYLRDLDSPVAVQLTHKADGANARTWTPTGRILFTSADGPNFRASRANGLWSVSAAGGEPEHVLSFPEGTSNYLAMTKDGATLAALRRDERGVGVWAGPIANGELNRYEAGPFAEQAILNTPHLGFSPDGRQLLLMWNTGTGEEAWLLPYPPDDHRPPRRILEALPAFSGTPTFSWMPDNRHIVVSTAERAASVGLYVADTVTGGFRAFPRGASTTHLVYPEVSPDGSRLVVIEVNQDYDIVTLEVASARVTPLLATNRVEQMPAWAADGSALVYVTNRNGAHEIWLREPGRDDRPLVTASDFPPGTTAGFMAPALSPDGRRVMYVRLESDAAGGITGTHLWTSAVDGGAPMRFIGGPGREIGGSWSPDGAWYAYLDVSSPMAMTLKKAKPSGVSNPELLAAADRYGTLPVWSPDGAWILYGNDGLKLISADGKTTRDVGLPGALCAFARGVDHLYCIKDVVQPSVAFVVVDFDGNVVRDPVPLASQHAPRAWFNPSWRLTLTPDGTGLTYGVDGTTMELLLVDGVDTLPLP